MKKLIVAAALCAAVLPRMAMSDEVELPEGYRQIEYVQGDGQAFIDLGFPMTEKLAVEVVAMPLQECGFFVYGERDSATSPSKSNFWGCNGADGTVSLEIYSPAYRLKGAGAADKFAYLRQFFGKKVCCRSSSSVRGYYDADTGNNLFSGSVQSTELPSGTTFTSENTCGLFTANGSSFWAVDYAFTGRIYSFTVTQDGEPYMNLVPCLTADGVAGFYDTVGVVDGKRFYGNTSGKGAFLYPKAVDSNNCVVRLPEDYTPVEYVQGDGQAYVDLKEKFTQEDEVVAEVMILDTENAMLFGSRGTADDYNRYSDAFYCGIDAATPTCYLSAGYRNGSMVGCNNPYFGADSALFLGIRVENYNTYLSHRLMIEMGPRRRAISDLSSGSAVVLNNGQSDTISLVPAFTTPEDMTLFTGRGNVWAKYDEAGAFTGRFYSFSVFRNAEARFVLVPCKKANGGEVGFFDAVSGKFFGNAAETGAFVAGPEIGGDFSNIRSQAFSTQPQKPTVHFFAPTNGVMAEVSANESSVISYSDNVAPGTATATCTYQDGAESKSVSGTFKILMSPNPDGYSLTGDFTLRVFGETGRVPVPAGIGVMGPNGPLAATDFKLVILGGDSTGRATIYARIKAGVDAGKVVTRTLPIVRLPEGFIPLEYVQGDGTAYTKIGDYHLGSSNAVDLVVTVTEAAAQGVYGGRRATSPKDGFLFGFAANGTKYDINLNYKNQSGDSGSLSICGVDLSVLLNRKALVRNEKNIRGFYSVEGTLLANGYENTTAPVETFTSENNFLVFDAQNIWATTSKFTGRIHSLAVTEGGADKFWLVPCKNASGEVGLYDGLSGVFYGNIAGEGAFIPGPVVKLPARGFAILLK